jgi:hypothetical protein
VKPLCFLTLAKDRNKRLSSIGAFSGAEGYVHTLYYRVDAITLYDENAPPIIAEIGVWKLHLANNVLTIAPTSRFKSVAEARTAVSPLLRAWEFEHAVIWGHDQLRFAFWKAEVIGTVIDADQQLAEQVQCVEVEDKPLIIRLREYPPLPNIEVTPDMEAIWERFKYARLGMREPLQSCAYYALTVVEQAATNRKQAASLSGIDFRVLRKLGELTSVRGDRQTARKAVSSASTPLSFQEKHWVESVVRYILLNLGYVAAGKEPMVVTMSDLPVLQ